MRNAPTTCRVFAILAISPLLIAPLGAQILEGVFQRHHTLMEDVVFGAGMGTSVSAAGDVNRDGVIDVIVGNPHTRFGGLEAGSAFVYSGADGSVLWRFDGEELDWLGASVAGAGDVDGDGFADVVVGAPSADDFRGSAIVYSGRGTVLWRFDGPFSRGALGHSVAGGVDVNRDGFPDILVGAPWSDPGGRELAGSVLVYSGKDGSTLFQLEGRAEGDRFGSAVAAVGVGASGDIDHDGFPDMIVGAVPWRSGPGSAFVISGKEGTILWWFRGGTNTVRDELGASVAGAGDVNRDGFPDVIVGAQRANPDGKSRAGSAFVHSGRDGSVLWRFDGGNPSERLGTAVAGAGDVNHDGFPDLLVGAAYARAGGVGSAFLYSGRDGSVLWRFNGTAAGERLGFAVAGAGDIDGDGFPEVILGAPGGWGGGLPGSAFVYGFRPAVVAYGTGLPGTGNLAPIMRAGEEAPRVGADFEISLIAGLGVAPCVIAASVAPAQTTLGSLTLYGDFLTPGAFATWGLMTGGIRGWGGTGIATVRMQIPGDPSLAGLTTYWQGFVMDHGSSAPIGVSHTGGLAVTVIR